MGRLHSVLKPASGRQDEGRLNLTETLNRQLKGFIRLWPDDAETAYGIWIHLIGVATTARSCIIHSGFLFNGFHREALGGLQTPIENALYDGKTFKTLMHYRRNSNLNSTDAVVVD
jgi:hypothetical protein